MEDKEEKYFIHKVWDETIIQGNKFTTFHNDYGVEFTRQEAIDKMSMALCNKEFKNKASAEDIDYCDRTAEVMLNALLEGGKK